MTAPTPITRDPDEPIAFEERSNGDHLIRFTIDEHGEAMAAIETDSGPLRQSCMRCTRADLAWISATADQMGRLLDRLEAEAA